MAFSAPRHRPTATTDQVVQAFTALSAVEQQNLRQIARLRSLGLDRMGWEDLLHEALYRALAGNRHWPLDVSFVAFLAQTMRSIASEERSRAASEPVEYESDRSSQEEDGASLVERAIDHRSVESDAMATGAIFQIEQLFARDPQAMHVLHGLAEGLTPAETLARSGMTQTEYASTQKRIQRALARRF